MMTDSPTPSTSRHHDDKCDKPEKPDKTVLLVSELMSKNARLASEAARSAEVDINLTSFRTLVTIFHVIAQSSRSSIAICCFSFSSLLTHPARGWKHRRERLAFHLLRRRGEGGGGALLKDARMK